MVNDGGLRDVLRTSEQVSSGLLSLSQIGGVPQSSTASAGSKRKPSRSLSEISGNTDRSVRMDLAAHTSAELKEAVAPLVRDLERLDAAALLSLVPSEDGNGATLDPRRGLTVPPIHDRITPRYKDEGPNIVRYLHVKEVPHKYSVGIFIFPPHAEIPLHDHPNMVVLSRVLYGELQVQSYDVVPENDNDNLDKDSSDNKSKGSRNEKAIATSSPKPSALASSFNKLKNFFVNRARFYPEDETDAEVDPVLHVKPNLKPMGVQMPEENGSPSIISAPSVTALYPYEGNCHTFMAGLKGAAVLDVLFPPYDSDDERDCTFYETNNEDYVSPVHQHVDRQHSLMSLTPIDQPEDFHCLSGTYGRFGPCEDNGDDGTAGDHDNLRTLCNLS